MGKAIMNLKCRLVTVITNILLVCYSVSVCNAQSFASYTETIKGTKGSFDMIAIAGGKAIIGSADNEVGRKKDEGPVHTVKLDDFWIGKHEVTWDLYELFVYPAIEKSRLTATDASSKKEVQVDAITTPTPPFTDMSFGIGKNGYPAVNMTQYAALAYCKWLTEKTGHFYRLPTEAEWEYACRAGSQQAYSFGTDKSLLTDYAWYSKNSNEKYHKTGTKKPNAWGLYDMHGNVAEWTLDQYLPDFYATAQSTKKNAWAEPSTLYPRVVKGGSWDDDAVDLRCAARGASARSWKKRDPQIPKSDWWNTDAAFVGFRVVRPSKQPSAGEIEKYFARQPEDF